ncbi:MAG: PQQ-binding-like beta-propeller repeat protein [Planctomycetaceae bacterium]|nr:PQQ-binding-like beta-propeller repeat protein [Planctomycetaceae bacterium]
MCRLCLLTLALIICGMGSEPKSLLAQNWPRFRGENGSGLSDLPGIPSAWTDDEYAWKIELPQVGHSSPIVWGKTLFITSATEGGGERFVHCLDADSGQERWQRSIQLNRSEKHQKNSWASSTPATDGRHVYVLFADDARQLVIAWDFSGNEVWRRDAGTYESEHGLGASPIVHDGLLLIPNDQVGPSSLIALNTTTGDVVWQSERLPGTTSYSTPIIVSNGQAGYQIIYLSQSNGITSLDPATGKLNWKTVPLPSRTVASPIESNGLIFATSGGGGTGKYLVALQSAPAVSDESRIVYERKTTLPYVPSMIAHNGMLFLWGDKGILVCLELLTGKEIWSHRIEGGFSGSPICIEDRIYCVTESGDVVVIRAGNQFEELGRTPLHDDCHSTPAVANGHLYLRTFRHLMAIKARDGSP